MQIRQDNLTGPEIIALLNEHLRCMEEVSPPESRHALNLDGLRKPEITFWTLWEGPELEDGSNRPIPPASLWLSLKSGGFEAASLREQGS